MARPRSGSTGLVKAVPVLWVGISSRQTGASDGSRAVAGRRADRVASGCSRDGAGRFRRCAGQLNSQVRVIARTMSTGWASGSSGQIVGVEVEAGPQEFGPEIVGDHPRIGSLQGPDAARSFQCSCGVEPARDPVPVLQVAEEGAGDANVGAFRLAATTVFRAVRCGCSASSPTGCGRRRACGRLRRSRPCRSGVSSRQAR